MNDTYLWGAIALIALITALLRFLPFLVFGKTAKPPGWLEKLGEALPYAIMGMLVVYCLKGTHFADPSGFVPPLVACLVTGALYIWKRNTLVSIILGTVCYMVLVQAVF